MWQSSPTVARSRKASFIGGSITLPVHIYKLIVGVVLLYSAFRLFLIAKKPDQETPKQAPLWIALFFGAAIGVISCHRGFNSRAGAEGVGRAATQAFVISFIAILILDFFLVFFLKNAGPCGTETSHSWRARVE